MRKLQIILIAVLVVAFSVTMYAQNIQPIVKGGVNIANMSGDDVGDPDSRMGFILGGLLSFNINEQFSFQTGPFYTQKGTDSRNLDYLEMPFLGRYNIPMDGKIQPNLFAGPSIAYNIIAEDDDGNDLSDWYSDFDAGLILGAGVCMGQISIDAEYNMGLMSIDDSGNDWDIKNSVITITAGYAIEL